jgi:hypothetical protein
MILLEFSQCRFFYIYFVLPMNAALWMALDTSCPALFWCCSFDFSTRYSAFSFSSTGVWTQGLALTMIHHLSLHPEVSYFLTRLPLPVTFASSEFVLVLSLFQTFFHLSDGALESSILRVCHSLAQSKTCSLQTTLPPVHWFKTGIHGKLFNISGT